jgi:hypothetical protein
MHRILKRIHNKNTVSIVVKEGIIYSLIPNLVHPFYFLHTGQCSRTSLLLEPLKSSSVSFFFSVPVKNKRINQFNYKEELGVRVVYMSWSDLRYQPYTDL